MKKHINIFAPVILLLLAFSGSVIGNDQSPPNFLIILGDDIDRDTLGPWGGQAKTPHLDQLAKDGMRLNNVYANVAMCAPFRQELYSGRTAWRTRAMPNHSGSVAGTKSLPHYLKPLGYRVGLIGKWHVKPKTSYPFDRLGEIPKNKDANPVATKLAKKYVTEARDAKTPFCLVVASHDAHGPYTHGNLSAYPSEKLSIAKDGIDTQAYRSNLVKHLAEVTNLDSLVGDLRKLLEVEKLTENTMVVFCSEQGNAFPFSKWTCFDDGLASGVIASLPNVFPAGKSCDQMMWIADLAPTLVEAAGGKVSEEDFDGRSQLANLKGGNNVVHTYAYGAFSNCNIIDNRERVFPIRSIRDERYSLIWSPRHDEEVTSNTTLTQALEFIESGKKEGATSVATSWVIKAKKTESQSDDELIKRLHRRPEWALYDRQNDPEELVNLIESEQHKEMEAKLKTELNSWLKRWNDADPVATERSFLKK